MRHRMLIILWRIPPEVRHRIIAPPLTCGASPALPPRSISSFQISRLPPSTPPQLPVAGDLDPLRPGRPRPSRAPARAAPPPTTRPCSTVPPPEPRPGQLLSPSPSLPSAPPSPPLPSPSSRPGPGTSHRRPQLAIVAEVLPLSPSPPSPAMVAH